MSYLTDDTDAALTLFDECYRPRRGDSGEVRFERVALPCAGGVLDQPAKVLAMLGWVERWQNDELRRAVVEHRRNKREQTDE